MQNSYETLELELKSTITASEKQKLASAEEISELSMKLRTKGRELEAMADRQVPTLILHSLFHDADP